MAKHFHLRQIMNYREEELQTQIAGIQKLEAKTRNPEYQRVLRQRRNRIEKALNSERRRAITLVEDPSTQLLNKVLFALAFLGICFLLFYFGK